ncbi:RNA methyltransferase [bacterium]|nr:RNA methyltransferase [bacterium]
MLTKNEQSQIKQLHQKKFRKQNDLFLVEGKKCCSELLKSDYEIEFFVKTGSCFFPELKDFQKTIRFEEVREHIFQSLSTHETPEGILAVAKVPQNKPTDFFLQKNLILALDGISDPGNLGTILRTADWFGVSEILLTKTCVNHLNPKVVRASMGAVFRENFLEIDFETLKTFKQNGFSIVGSSLSEKSRNLQNFALDEKTILFLGSEAHGISKECEKLCDNFVKIESFGSSESLNVGVATGILLFNFKKSHSTGS